MILAAGLGTRLRPLTNERPKALVEIDGRPLLDILIQKLIQNNFQELIINVHHFADQITQFLAQKSKYGIRIEISDERDQLLDTGGALKKAAWFFDDQQPFLLCNTDIISDLDFRHFYQNHLENDAIATLATRQRLTSRYLIFDLKEQLCGWTNVKTGEVKMLRHGAQRMQLLAFSGIHVISPRLFEFMPKEKAVFSIIDTYLEVASSQKTIRSFRHDEDDWLDVGKMENLSQASVLLEKLSAKRIK